MATKFQKHLALANYEGRELQRSKKSFYKNNVEFRCDSNTIVVFKQDGVTKMGGLHKIVDGMAHVNVHKVQFDPSLIFFEILAQNETQMIIPFDDLYGEIGHIYEYGIEPDIKKVILFKHILQ